MSVKKVAAEGVGTPRVAETLFRKPGGEALVDPSKFYYYGISQGGIMGTTVCGIDPVIEKCVVQVGAINYSMMLERSRDWPTYRTTLIGAYPDPLDTSLIISLMQWEWDRTEPTVVAGWSVARTPNPALGRLPRAYARSVTRRAARRGLPRPSLFELSLHTKRPRFKPGMTFAHTPMAPTQKAWPLRSSACPRCSKPVP